MGYGDNAAVTLKLSDRKATPSRENGTSILTSLRKYM